MFEDYRVKNFPIPGIEPGPSRSQPAILSATPYGTIKQHDLRTICILLFHRIFRVAAVASNPGCSGS